MSWLLGNFGNENIRSCCPESPEVVVEKPGFCLYAGGNPRTFTKHQLPNGDQVLVLGYPVYFDGNQYVNLTPDKLLDLMKLTDPTESLDGHYLILRIRGREIDVFNDKLGKRSLYIYQHGNRTLFTTHIAILRKAVNPELDFHKLGPLWHTRYPTGSGKYCPSLDSYYRHTTMLGTGSKATLKNGKVEIVNHPFHPDSNKGDIFPMIESFCLSTPKSRLPIAISLSGGMDIRSLLAVFLKAKVNTFAVHYGREDTSDYHIARKISEDNGIAFRHIGFKEAEGNDPWQQVIDYMQTLGLVANPVEAPYIGFYKEIARESDLIVSGYFGSLYRIRIYVTHLLNWLNHKQLKTADLHALLRLEPPPIFQPDCIKELNQGYRECIESVYELLNNHRDLNNLLLLDLLLAGHSPASMIQNTLTFLDQHIVDHMPWLQSRILSQHWHYGLAYQFMEGIHRDLIKRNWPSLAKYPIALYDIQAPYNYQAYMVKVKSWYIHRFKPVQTEDRVIRLLTINRESILDLFNSKRVRDYAPYRLGYIEKSIEEFYKGERRKAPVLMSWLSVELGR